MPSVLILVVLICWLIRRCQRSMAAGLLNPQPMLTFSLGKWRWPLTIAVGTAFAVLTIVPLGSLVWRAGLQGSPPTFSVAVVLTHLRLLRQSEPHLLLNTLLLAMATGVVVAGLALLTCWAALGSRTFRLGTLVQIALAWALPGPVIGLGLKRTIAALLDVSTPQTIAQSSNGPVHRADLLAKALWYGPSPLPLAWTYLIRFLPCAIILFWPMVRRISSEMHDAALVDGAGRLAQLRHVVWPSTRAGFLWATLAVAILSLGELSAGKLVSTPGFPSYAEVVFTHMHYGVTNDLAARCLWLLGVVLAGGIVVAISSRWLPGIVRPDGPLKKAM
jgi:ABC-type Fe3+ transport system permease subunit